ncbi:MAG: SUMF1/EgtB/PvdO family nonheme iron enzyme [Gammaproteobacteria bacterium]|nr:SUMF1/EgtB/PvdO family nonheme iron enzyme [Gammaproteobacteria bacterium]
MSETTIPVILAYPEEATTTYLESLLQHYQFNISIQSVHSVEDLYTAVGAQSDRFIVLTELFWDGADGSDIILSLMLGYPRGAFAVISSGPIADFLPRDFPAPHVQGFEDTEKIINIFTSFTEDLRGQHFGPFQIRDFAGQSQAGQIYDAIQPAIKREVYLTVPYTHADEETLANFKEEAAAQAGNSSPYIYAIYEETSVLGRTVLSQEPVAGPSLFQFYLNASTFDDRLLAKILHTTAGALKHLNDSRIPHPRIKAKHITLSENGVIKIHNTALPSDSKMPDEIEEVRLLAEIVESFVDSAAETDPRLAALLAKMKNGETDLTSAIHTANQIDVDLAPVKLVPERAQAKKAQQEVVKARKSYWIWLMIGGGSATAMLIFVIIYVMNTYVIVDKGTNFSKQFKITAGEAYNPKTKQMEQVGEFYMDEYEITIGQYEAFLKATAGKKGMFKKLLPPDFSDRSKKNFIPRDWKAMIEAVKRKRAYPGLAEKINRDTPIFNIEYADAYAYAKWAGKRLPTELEWTRAASGDENFKLPWGNKPDLTKANTGADREKSERVDTYGGLDGFRGIADVNANGKTDVSPFGIKNMAGNVTEWVAISPELGPLEDEDSGAQRGGNFGSPLLMSNQKRINYPLHTRKPWLGFRCASDKPVQAPKM